MVIFSSSSNTARMRSRGVVTGLVHDLPVADVGGGRPQYLDDESVLAAEVLVQGAAGDRFLPSDAPRIVAPPINAYALTMAAYFLIFAFYVQESRALGALQAGLVLTPIGAGYVAASLLAPKLAARFGRQVIALGGMTRAVGLTALLVAVAGHWPIGWRIPALLVDGIGMGLALAPIMGTVLARVASHHAGAAAGVLATAQQVGGAIGVGIVGIVYYGSVSAGVTQAFQHGLVYLIVIALVLAGCVQLLPRAGARA